MALSRVAVLSRCEANNTNVAPCILRQFPASLLSKIELHEVSHADVPASLPFLRTTDIIVADPPLILPYLSELKALKWFQSTYAGVNSLMTPELQTRGLLVTRFAGCLGPAMAEYALGMIISVERRFPEHLRNQQQSKWGDLAYYRPLNQLTLGVLGASGDIGGEVAKAGKKFGMKVQGFARRPREQGDLPFLDKCHHGDQGLGDLLGEIDYLVCCLPSTKETAGLLSGEVLRQCKKKPTIINVGRGDLIDEDSIIKALDQGWIKTMVVDVAAKEPLAETSPLWKREDVIITPHVSALSFPEDVAETFQENLKLWLEGKPLNNVVDFERGY